MRIFALIALAAGAALLVSGASHAQTLGEVAERERLKKKQAADKKAPVKIITEEDLRNSRGASASSPAATPDAAGESEAKTDKPADSADAKPATAAAPKEKTEDELKAEAAKAWRDKLTHAQSEATRLQGVVDSLQLKLNDMTQPMYGGARTAQIAQLEEAKVSLATARKMVEDLTEEGRRSSFR